MRKLWKILVFGAMCIGVMGWATTTRAQEKPSLERVFYMLKHPYWRIKWQGLCWLEEYYGSEKKAVEVVSRIMRPKDPKNEYATTWKLRRRAALWLSTISHQTAWIELMAASVSEPHWRVRLLLAEKLGDSPVLQKQAWQHLQRLQKDQHAMIRKMAVQSQQKLVRFRQKAANQAIN